MLSLKQGGINTSIQLNDIFRYTSWLSLKLLLRNRPAMHVLRLPIQFQGDGPYLYLVTISREKHG